MKQKLVWCLIITLFLLSSSAVVKASESKFVLFVVDKVDLSEWGAVKTPYFDRLVNRGSVALMNCKTAGSLETKDAYLTIGSGQRATVGTAGYLNFNLEEEYKGNSVTDLYTRRIGKLDDRKGIANIKLARIKQSNAESDYQARVGYLGSLLTQANKRVAVLGNADIWKQPRRQIGLMGINNQGLGRGDVGERMRQNVPHFPSGYITNQAYLLKQLNNYWSNSDFLIIESGDTSRVEAVKKLLTVHKYKDAKKQALRQVDKLLGKIMNKVDLDRDYLMLVTPTPSNQGIKEGNKLTLTVLVGPEIKNGLLISDTTKRRGLITNLDLAPTIYQTLTSRPASFTGQNIDSISFKNPLIYLSNLNRKIKKTFSWRPKLVRWFIFLQIITVTVAALILIYRKKITFIKQFVIIVMVSLLWLPVFFLLSSFFLNYDLGVAFILWLGMSFLLAFQTVKRYKNNILPVIFPALIITILLVFDLWRGGKWIKLSVFGYSPIIGARFYGIGNEFMGMLIGAGLMVLSSFIEDRGYFSNWKVLIFLFLLVFTIGYPALGANFGGLITSLAACSFVYFSLIGVEFNWKFILKICLILAVGVLLALLLEIYGGEGIKTHLGRLVSRIKQQGIKELILIIYRKIKINLRLLRWTIWSRVLLAFVAVLVILFKWPKGEIKELISKYPYLTIGIKGSLLGSIVTMCVNDSGVVAAATLLLYPVFTLLYLAIKKTKLN